MKSLELVYEQLLAPKQDSGTAPKGLRGSFGAAKELLRNELNRSGELVFDDNRFDEMKGKVLAAISSHGLHADDVSHIVKKINKATNVCELYHILNANSIEF